MFETIGVSGAALLCTKIVFYTPYTYLAKMVVISSLVIFFFNLSGWATYHFCNRNFPCRLKSNMNNIMLADIEKYLPQIKLFFSLRLEYFTAEWRKKNVSKPMWTSFCHILLMTFPLSDVFIVASLVPLQANCLFGITLRSRFFRSCFLSYILFEISNSRKT